MLTTTTDPTSGPTTSTTPATDVLVLLQTISSLRAKADECMRSSALNIAKARRGASYRTSCVGGDIAYTVESVREELRASALLGWKRTDEGHDVVDVVEPPHHLARVNDDDDIIIDIDDDAAAVRCHDDCDDDHCDDDHHHMVADAHDGNGPGIYVLHLDGMGVLSRRIRTEPTATGVEEEGRAAIDDDILVGGGGGGTSRDEGLRRRRVPRTDGGEEGRTTRRTNDGGEGVDEWTTENNNIADDELSHDNGMERRLRNADPLCLFGLPPPALRAAQASSRDALSHYVEMANVIMRIQGIMNESGG